MSTAANAADDRAAIVGNEPSPTVAAETERGESASGRALADDVDAIHTRYRIADASLAVGVVALGAAAVWFVLRPASGAPSAAAPSPAAIDVSPVQRGGVLTWRAPLP